MSQRNISSLAYRKLRFTNKVPVVGDQVFLHRAPTGIIGTVVSVHEDPYVPVVDIEFSDGSVIEMVPRGNVRVVSEMTERISKKETMKITKRQLRRIIREAAAQSSWLTRLGAAIADGPHAIAELYVDFYKDDADVYFDEDRSYLRREGVQDLDLRQIGILIGKLINQLVHDRKLRKTNSLYAKEIEAIGRGLYSLDEEDFQYLDYKPVVRGGKTVSVTVIDHEGPRGYPMGRSEMNISPSDAQSAGTTLPQVVRALEQLGAKRVTRRPPKKNYPLVQD